MAKIEKRRKQKNIDKLETVPQTLQIETEYEITNARFIKKSHD